MNNNPSAAPKNDYECFHCHKRGRLNDRGWGHATAEDLHDCGNIFHPSGATLQPSVREPEPPITVEDVKALSGDHMEITEAELPNFHIHEGKLYILESVAAKAIMRGEERLMEADREIYQMNRGIDLRGGFER